MTIKKFLSLVWAFLPFTRTKKDRLFKDISVGRAIIAKTYVDGKPLVRVGYVRTIKEDYLMVFFPSISDTRKVIFDGVNYIIND